MSRFLLILAVVAASAGITGASAQSKINPAGRRILNEAVAVSRAGAAVSGEYSVGTNVLTIVRLEKGADPYALEEQEGVKVHASRADMAIVELPLGGVEQLAALPAVRRVTFGNEMRPLMNKARVASEANRVINGANAANGLNRNYRGAGVIAGMMDNGLDAGHVNFMKSDGTIRIERIWLMSMNSDYTEAQVQEYSSASAIAGFTTDSRDATHATHVAGIMAGSYNGTGTVAVEDADNGSCYVGEANVPFYGIASEASLAFGCGRLYDACILLAGEKLLAYARSQGKPAVFNLSVGSTMGPHDGTDDFCRYLAELGKEMIICIAAGNDGTSNVSIQHQFSTSAPEVKTFIPLGDSGVVETWSDNSQPFSAKFVIYDTAADKIIYTRSIDPADDYAAFTTEKDPTNGYEYDKDLASAFTSSDVYMDRSVDDNNNRFNIYIQYSLTQAAGKSNLVPGLSFSGNPGVAVNSWLFMDGQGFSSRGVAGWNPGNPSQSISGMACGDNVIVVGSYVSRDKWPTLTGNFYGYNSPDVRVGYVSDFTSYGMVGGRTLPDLCAPGEGVVSSYSTYYIDDNFSDDQVKTCSARVESTVGTKSRENYWYVSQGTSMATPYVSGVAALMLEADPTLAGDVARMKTLLTTRMLPHVATDAKEHQQWGAGRISAYEAMLALLGRPSAIANVGADADRRLLIDRQPGMIRVALPGENGISVTLHTLAGASAAAAAGAGEELTLSTEALPAGIYIVNATGSTGQRATKTIVIP